MLSLQDTSPPPTLMRQPHRSVTLVHVHYFQVIFSEHRLLLTAIMMYHVCITFLLWQTELKAAELFFSGLTDILPLVQRTQNLVKGKRSWMPERRKSMQCTMSLHEKITKTSIKLTIPAGTLMELDIFLCIIYYLLSWCALVLFMAASLYCYVWHFDSKQKSVNLAAWCFFVTFKKYQHVIHQPFSLSDLFWKLLMKSTICCWHFAMDYFYMCKS